MIKRKRVIRIVSYLLAVCVVLTVSGRFSVNAKESYEQTLEKVRLNSLNSLCEYVGVLSTSLSLLSAMPDYGSTVTVSSCVSGALAVTGCFNGDKITNIKRFLNYVYAFAQDFKGDEESCKAASQLSDYAEEMYCHLSDMSVAIMNGAYSLSEHGSVYKRNDKPYFEEHLDFSNGKEKEIYALAVSASAGYGRQGILSNAQTVSSAEAKVKASSFVELNPIFWRESEKESGGVELYLLSHGDTAVEITKKGGMLCRLINPLPCNQAVFSCEDAEIKVKDFLIEQGFDAEVFAFAENTFTADFLLLPYVNGVLLTTASVKASVCLSSGEITYFDATEYIKNYRENAEMPEEIPNLELLLPEKLNIEKIYACYADINGDEKPCYLAVCKHDGKEFCVYADNSGVLKTEKITLRIKYNMV